MNRLFSTLLIIGLAAAFWVMPSVGTQGMGTIGQRFTHPDRPFLDATEPSGRASTDALQSADHSVEAALGF